MAVFPQFIALVSGQWNPICQQRQSRKSLLICVLGIDVVLSLTQNSPTATGPVGDTPAGIYLEGGQDGVPTIFRLSLAIDDDLVTQQWYAYPVAGTSPTQQSFVDFSAVTGGDVWTAPANTIRIDDIWAWGSSGYAGDAGGGLGGGGGGGGSFSSSGPLTAAAGDTFTVIIQVAGFGSLTQVTSSVSGVVVRALAGGNGVLDVGGGSGGILAAIGVVKTAGGAGADATALGGVGGGGGGGAAHSGDGGNAAGVTGGLAGGPDTLGLFGPAQAGSDGQAAGLADLPGAQPGGGSGGPGTGGANDHLFAIGQVVIAYTTATPIGQSAIVTVFESFEAPSLDDPDFVDPTKFLTVNLPKLTRRESAALHDLISKLKANQENTDETSNGPEHDNGNRGFDSPGNSQSESAT